MTKHILHVFPSFTVGGSQRRFATHVNNSSANLRHSVLAMDGRYEAMDLIRPDRQPEQPGFTPYHERLVGAIMPYRDRLAEIAPDLLVGYNWGSVEWMLANCLGRICPMIQIQDGFGPDEAGGEKRLRKWVRRLAYNRAKKVVVPSHTLLELARTSWKIAPEKLLHIPNGVDSDRFDRDTDPEMLHAFNLQGASPIIGTVAALRPEKNLGRLIEAFLPVAEKYDTARLVIVGDGMARAALSMLVERVGLKGRVTFTGPVSTPERLIPAFDLFALSSDTEQMPLAVVEAMLAGRPVAATDVGDVARMVSEANRPFVQGTDAAELSGSMLRLLEDGTDRAHIGAANREKARSQYRLDTMIEAYDRLMSDPDAVSAP
ncbi:glycosyltransferase family 4 protein [Yunchengibacter salinarum]|uniref:glycosyltransferase family 4 protein n=1 Tax=Yunchengibacter salinarum TaxID=3133399 RepID=UPI0035B60B6B